MPEAPVPQRLHAFIERQRVAHLATADKRGRPHVVPVCFAFDGRRFYIALDAKPKRTAALQLKRVRNILANPHVALLFDRYDDDWTQLGYVLVHGRAAILQAGSQNREAIALLRQRYPQYREMSLEEAPVFQVTPERSTAWGKVG